MKYLSFALIFFGLTSHAQIPADSAHSILLDGYIKAGKIISDTPSEQFSTRYIREQLKYTVGQLNGFAGVADLNRIEIEVVSAEKLSTRRYLITYTANLVVAWPRDERIPARFDLILPRRGDFQGLSQFTNDYSNCVSSSTPITSDNFWYYYRPNKYNCPLNLEPESNSSLTFPMELSVSDENTEGKYPEYEKIWEDGRLVITAIFGKNEAMSQSEFDAGVRAFYETHLALLNYFGKPIESSIQPHEKAGLKNPEIRLVFDSENGEVEVHLLLIDGIAYASGNFITKYNKLTRNSDFISYSGHSGLGANIRLLAQMGEYRPGQYQIFLINGCDTFAYVDNALRDAHASINPGSSPHKYFDVITNAMPAYFHSNALAVMSMVEGLTEKKSTYREILSNFDSYQKAIVTGEEDNRWPEKF